MIKSHESKTYFAIAGALVVVLASLAATGSLVGAGAASATIDPGEQNATIEDAYEEQVPEEGDEYFEAADPDGAWVSYINPRDSYRSPYLGDGSGKICVTLLNEEGEHVVGESVPGTTVTIPTGKSIEWHPYADPMVVEFPLTEHYDRPLDADQFGTSSEFPQGDGYLDSHCIEIHGLSEEGDSIEYGEPEIDGEYADWIEVVGYVQQEPAGTGWDTDVDPIDDAVSYEETGGGWTYEPDSSHGQVVIVLQLDPPEDAYPDFSENGSDDDGADDDGDDDGADDTSEQSANGDDESGAEEEPADDDGSDRTPGFGALLAVAALVGVGLLRSRR